MSYTVKIIKIIPVTHNVRSYRVEKPAGYTFTPGQATEVSINKSEWKEEKRPFTFTSLNSEPYLEFTIKSYTDHNGVTNELFKIKEGEELIIRDVWGAIEYKGPGYFIAGGAGITPFIAILRQLQREGRLNGNKLFFSNRTGKDIILKDELKEILGKDCLNVITDEQSEEYFPGFIDEKFIKEHVTDFKAHFYICGPDPMVKAISDILVKLGASPEAVVFEK
jgi:glycine betaine catabolism B